MSRQIQLRWRRWEPWVLLYLRQQNLPSSMKYRLEEQHRVFLERCLKIGIPHFSRVMERHEIDDPRVSESEREKRLQQYLQRRPSR